ncbi:hypothetical protein KR067_000129, partial [Drosophila pandora]
EANQQDKMSSTGEFIHLKIQYESKEEELEHEGFDCCRWLYKKHMPNNDDCGQPKVNPKSFVSWVYNLQEFPPDNIIIQLKEKFIYLNAFKHDPRDCQDLIKRILMPDKVDQSKVTCKMSSKGILTIT